jgi:sRNA-binding carbon storage regulator CsrA
MRVKLGETIVCGNVSFSLRDIKRDSIKVSVKAPRAVQIKRTW